jgi:hypothetical protein
MLLWASSARGELTAIRPLFQVSTGPKYSYYSYAYPHNEALFSIDIGASDAGTFVVVWDDLYMYVGYDSRPGIFRRRFNSFGLGISGELRTSSQIAYIQGSSHVASDKDGNFVVVWDERDYDYVGPGDLDGLRIMARRYNASGGPTGPPFQVNTYTTYSQYTPKVGFDGAGNFMVVWAYYDNGYMNGSAVLAAQKYNSSGTPIGGEFQVNTYTTCCIGYSGLEYPGIFDDIDVAGDEAGNFVVVWSGPGTTGDNSYRAINARFFDSTGTPQGDQFLVSTNTTLGEFTPTVRPDHQGNFVIAWAQDYWSTIFLRRYDASGTPLGGDFQVNDDPYGYFGFSDGPSIAADATGRFVVAWEEYDYGVDAGDGIRGREFDSTGTPVAGEFRIDAPNAYGDYGYYTMRRGKVATSAAGDFVVVWGQYGTPAYGSVWAGVGRKLGLKPTPCSATPLMGCRETTENGVGVLAYKNAPNPKSSRMNWRFLKGPLASGVDFGDPFNTDSYAVCLYDGSANPQPLYAAPVPAGGACGHVPCWKEVGTAGGVDYYDPKAQWVQGLTEIRLLPGPAGRSKALVRGRGTRLTLPDPPLTAPVTLQLQGSHGQCWSATYSTQIMKNADGAFKAKADL